MASSTNAMQFMFSFLGHKIDNNSEVGSHNKNKSSDPYHGRRVKTKIKTIFGELSL